jgi:short-subunit dehydrogenase
LAKVPGATSMSVAEAGYAGLMAGRRTIVPGLGNKAAAMLLPLVPDAILQPLVYRFQRGRI